MRKILNKLFTFNVFKRRIGRTFVQRTTLYSYLYLIFCLLKENIKQFKHVVIYCIAKEKKNAFRLPI